MVRIRKYKKDDNLKWVRCRVLSFLDTAYYDDVLKEKQHYKKSSIELVAEIDGKIVGLMDTEYEIEKGEVCYKSNELGAVIWHLAVLPEYRNKGISTTLLNQTINILKGKDIKVLQAWTRDDIWVNDWYKKRGFNWRESYLHVYKDRKDCDKYFQTKIENMVICSCFAHYIGTNKEEIKDTFKRVHECNLYELTI